MTRRVTLVGALSIGYGVLRLVAAGFVAASIAAMPLAGSPLPAPWKALTALPGGIAVLLVLLGILDIAFGAALLRLRPWARVPLMVLAVLNLVSLPIGTAIGVYTLWVLTRYPTLQETDPQPACC